MSIQVGRKITVPDMNASEIMALAEKKGMSIGRIYQEWDFFRGRDGRTIPGRGKTFEPVIWNPDDLIGSEVVRLFNREQGLIGLVSAFTVWWMTYHLFGAYACIPDDNGCFRAEDRHLYSPLYTTEEGGDGKLYLDRINLTWVPGWSFVGFREVPA